MKYVVEIDDTTKVGEEAIKYLRTLKKGSKAVHIREVEEEDPNRPFTAEELALPFGRVPTDEQLEEFLNRKQGRGSSGEVVRKRILKKLADGRKK